MANSSTDTTARVMCELNNAGARINGVRFVPVAGPAAQGEPPRCMSEPVSSKVAAAFVAIPGYRIATDDEVKQYGEDAERRLALATEADRQKTLGSSSAQKQVEELQRANQALSAERNKYRDEAEKLKAEKGPARIGELEAKMTALEADVARLQGENEELRRVNDSLAQQPAPTTDRRRGSAPRAGRRAAAAAATA